MSSSILEVEKRLGKAKLLLLALVGSWQDMKDFYQVLILLGNCF